jgi:hypothetical protein
MITVTCDRCGRSVPLSIDSALVIESGGVRLTADLCETCQKIVTTDWRILLATWAEERAA